MRIPLKYLVALLLAAFLAAACGARVDDQQVASLGGTSGGVQTGTAGGTDTGAVALGGDEPVAGPGETAEVAAPVEGAAPEAEAGGDPAAAGGPAAPGAPAPAAPAPAGGNGGATDIGVTPTEVLLGNVSTLSGPVPGLFQGAVIGAQAVVAYQNSLGGMFGRKFKLDVRDDQFDTGSNRAATQALLGKVFAFAGSFSLYDDAAADAVGKSGIPDVSYSLSGARRGLPNNFAVQPAYEGGAPTSQFVWFKQKFPDAIKAVGTIYGDVPASKSSHLAYKKAAESLGYKYVYERGVAPTESDYTADVVRMRQSGVKMVWLIATDDKTTARLLKAMEQQGFKPDVISANYMPTLVGLAGASAEGVYGPTGAALFGGEDNGVVPEVGLMNQWIQKVKPGFKSDVFSTYAWASGRLLFQAMEKVGPNLTRARVLEEIRKIDKFSANELLAEAGPGAKRPSTCTIITQIKSGKYVRVDPARGFICLGPYHRRSGGDREGGR